MQLGGNLPDYITVMKAGEPRNKALLSNRFEGDVRIVITSLTNTIFCCTTYYIHRLANRLAVK